MGALLLALALTAGLQQQAPRMTNATVSGQVRSERTGAPLRYAVVEMIAPGSIVVLSASTDSNGIYTLRGVPHGRQIVRASHINHAPVEVEIYVAADRQVFDFDLELRPVRLPVVNANALRPGAWITDTLGLALPELSAANTRAIEATPGMAELGLAETPPPGYDPIDPHDVLFVRGSAVDLKLVLLNGAPVYAPYHIGGLVEALDADLLRAATLYLSGAPARYDGGVSYVMDLETRAGRGSGPHVSLGADLLAARGSIEGPVGRRITYLASGRHVHGRGTDLFFVDRFPYGYSDALGRIDLALGDSSNLSLSGFRNQESVLLDSLPDLAQVAEWGNRAGSARFSSNWGGTAVVLTMGIGEFRTGLPLSGVVPLLTQGISQRTRYNADLHRDVGPLQLYFGLSREELGFEYRAWSRGLERDSVVARTRARGEIHGAYVDGALHAHERLRLRGGLRADRFSLEEGVRLAPRLAATLLLTQNASLTLAGGTYRQYVRAPGRSIIFLGNPASDTLDERALAVAEASHLTLALTQDLGEGIRLGVEGYYKDFEGLPSTPEGHAEASGMDLWVRRSTGALRGWLSYSLGWVWTSRENRPRPLQTFAGRHLISAGLAGPLPAGGGFDVRVSYGAGLPYTAIPEPEVATPVFSASVNPVGAFDGTPPTPGPPTDPDRPYLRIDAELERTWAGSVGGLAFEVTPYLRLLNALNRRDALFYHYDADNGSAEPLAGLPLLPLVGMQWRF